MDTLISKLKTSFPLSKTDLREFREASKNYQNGDPLEDFIETYALHDMLQEVLDWLEYHKIISDKKEILQKGE